MSSANVPQSIVELGLTSYASFPGYQTSYNLLLNKLQQLPNWSDIDKTFSGSGTLELILYLISSNTEINSFMNLRGVQESYLEFAQISENIYAKAGELGYRINRPSCPIISVEYLGVTTLTITTGTIIGSYLSYDLIYFGAPKVIEKGDIIDINVGKYQEVSYSFSNTSTTAIINILTPSILSAIDNNLVNLVYSGISQTKTLFPEDYIVFNNYADFSATNTTAKIFVADFTLSHGLSNVFSKNLNTSYTIQYIETDGPISGSSNINLFVTNSNYRPLAIVSNGYNSDTLSSIVQNAPLVYSLLRRCITEKDWVFLLSSLPQFKSASIIPYGGIIGIYDISVNLTTISTNYYIVVNSITYAYQNLDSLPVSSVLKILFNQIRQDTNVTPELQIAADGPLIRIYSQSSRIPINISTSPNLTKTVIQQQVTTKPCILQINYVSANTITDPVPLTYADYNIVANITDNYKQVGLTLYYLHALRIDISLTYTFSLASSSDQTLVTTLVNQVISSYNYRVDFLVDSSEILTIINNYINYQYGVNVVLNSSDAIPLIKYINKTSYCLIVCNISFV
jgi:hypothetical protein